MNWVQSIVETVAREGACARVVIIGTAGPTPRSVGAAMLVWGKGQSGKIGRGPIEAAAVERARQALAEFNTRNTVQSEWQRECIRLQTGDVLGESTGGSVRLLIELYGRLESEFLSRTAPDGDAVVVRQLRSGSPPRFEAVPRNFISGIRLAGADGEHEELIESLRPAKLPFHVYGTGLVARALVKCLVDLPLRVVWHDRAPGHFPAAIPNGAICDVSDDLAGVARGAASGAAHAVMTADHDLDLAICRALLDVNTFGYLGVIGSQLKRDRLESKLTTEGFEKSAFARLSCPIGLPHIRSKNPSVIAVSIAAEALSALKIE